jgi:hypothetical protein
MKTLELNQMALTKGGGGNWGDWVCGGVGVGAIFVSTVLKCALGPMGAAISTGCAIYGVGRLADWW